MPERIYKGAHAAVEIEVDGVAVLAEKDGAPVTVGEEQAKEMDASAAWAKPGSKSKEKE